MPGDCIHELRMDRDDIEIYVSDAREDGNPENYSEELLESTEKLVIEFDEVFDQFDDENG